MILNDEFDLLMAQLTGPAPRPLDVKMAINHLIKIRASAGMGRAMLLGQFVDCLFESHRLGLSDIEALKDRLHTALMRYMPSIGSQRQDGVVLPIRKTADSGPCYSVHWQI